MAMRTSLCPAVASSIAAHHIPVVRPRVLGVTRVSVLPDLPSSRLALCLWTSMLALHGPILARTLLGRFMRARPPLMFDPIPLLHLPVVSGGPGLPQRESQPHASSVMFNSLASCSL